MQTASLRLRFQIVRATAGGTTTAKCALSYRWDTDRAWFAFGDPVPLLEGALDGFHVHDVYHLTLLAETGWSAVLGILVGGDRDGVFGGPGALAEEAVVMDWYMRRPNPTRKVCALLSSASGGHWFEPAAVDRAKARGDACLRAVQAKMAAHGRAVARIDDIPVTFRQKCLTWRRRSGQRALPARAA